MDSIIEAIQDHFTQIAENHPHISGNKLKHLFDDEHVRLNKYIRNYIAQEKEYRDHKPIDK